MLDTLSCVVSIIPSDGNCMFGAIVHQLFQFPIESTMHRAMTLTLREMTVTYLRENITDADLFMTMSLRVADEYPYLGYGTRAVERFLDMLARDGIWGSAESLVAISRIFECDIVLLHENGHRDHVFNRLGRSARTINVVYRGVTGSWNHYDSFECFDVCPRVVTSNGQIATPVCVVTAGGRQCHVKPTDRDGNCMFYSIAHQLFPFDMNSSGHRRLADKLREKVVDYLRINLEDARCRDLLVDRITSDYPHLRGSGGVTSFLRILSTPQVWGDWKVCLLWLIFSVVLWKPIGKMVQLRRLMQKDWFLVVLCV